MTDTMSTEPVRLDVRPIIGAGDEPFETIIAAAEKLAEGGVLELKAPFRPVPIYPVMRQRGFAATTDQRAPAEWVVRFRQTGITTESLLAGVAERHPATVEVLAKYGFDLCCGGAKPIEAAARAHGVDLDVLLDGCRRGWEVSSEQGAGSGERASRKCRGPLNQTGPSGGRRATGG